MLYESVNPFPTKIFLNAKYTGKNFTCRQITTIDNKFENEQYSRPTIDNVSVGTNVCIIDDVHIGDNAVIGGGSVVINDIPANGVVMGNPARIINDKIS